MCATGNLMEWESKLFLEVMEEDGLLVMARGLGMDRIVLEVLKTFCKNDNFVLVLNTIVEEQNFYINELEASGVTHLPKIVTADISIEERRKSYLQGGVFFITSRILVVDMLTKRIPIEYITGILIQRAHKISVSSQESFILRMYRENNVNGFIKGFSDSPTSFISGYCQVERVMKNLFVRYLHLRPRFHSDIIDFMEKHKPDVIEINVNLSPIMSAIQLSLLDLVQITIRELKTAMPSLDPEQITLENSLQYNFDRMLKLQLDPVWNELTSRIKDLVADLKVLRILLTYLTNYDCVTFYNFLESLQKNEKNKKSIWMLSNAANSIYSNAKARVMGLSSPLEGQKKTKVYKPENCPKWEVLSHILDEIDGYKKEEVYQVGNKKVLICTTDERTSYQLSQVLCLGSEKFLQSLFLRSSLSKDKEDRNLEDDFSDATEDNLTEQMVEEKKGDDDGLFLKVLRPDTMVMIHSLTGNSDPYSLLKRLYEFQPTFVIMYDVSMEFVRQIEVYKAIRVGIPLRVYFMFYSGSIEEQRYLTTLKNEKVAFELLIRQKAEMVIPEERQGKSEVARSALRDVSKASENVASTRKAGGREMSSSKVRRIVVDLREFRSELPSLIHRRGIELDPVTLEVGDYILRPDICVERKSISDLIGSLNSGRLYNQCVAMTRYYDKPVLLIEFDESRSFSLQAKMSLKSEVSLQNISSKLALLTIHFPKLRIIWSQSPHLTAEIFDDLKVKGDEPISDVAIAIGVEGDIKKDIFYNIVPQDMLQKIPGINSKNYRLIMDNYNNLKELLNAKQDEINDALENTNSTKQLHEFVTSEQTVTQPIIKKRKK